MKQFINIFLVNIGLFASSSAFSAYGIFEDIQATCYIFKDNKLNQKQSCVHSGMTGRDVEDTTSSDIDQHEFVLANGHKINTINNIETVHNSKRIIRQNIRLNQNKASIYYRDLSFKVINKSQAQKNWQKALVCYKSKQLDFCYGK